MKKIIERFQPRKKRDEVILNTLQTIASNIYYTNKKIENIEKELNNIKDAVYYLSQERQMDIRSLN